MQLQEMNSPFNKEQVELLNRLLPTLTETQRIWLSGYLTALQGLSTPGISNPIQQSALTPAVQMSTQEIAVLFGSQTGNGQRLAEGFSRVQLIYGRLNNE